MEKGGDDAAALEFDMRMALREYERYMQTHKTEAEIAEDRIQLKKKIQQGKENDLRISY